MAIMYWGCLAGVYAGPFIMDWHTFSKGPYMVCEQKQYAYLWYVYGLPYMPRGIEDLGEDHAHCIHYMARLPCIQNGLGFHLYGPQCWADHGPSCPLIVAKMFHVTHWLSLVLGVVEVMSSFVLFQFHY